MNSKFNRLAQIALAASLAMGGGFALAQGTGTGSAGTGAADGSRGDNPAKTGAQREFNSTSGSNTTGSTMNSGTGNTGTTSTTGTTGTMGTTGTTSTTSSTHPASRAALERRAPADPATSRYPKPRSVASANLIVA